MHLQTHIMSGWCGADLVKLTPRERALAMVAASAPDLDGLGIVCSMEAYGEYHHVLGHNLLAGLLVAGVLTVFSTHRAKAFALYFALFHLHLVLDYFGSGPGWGIAYLWPFSEAQLLCPYAWPLTSWQNITAAALFLAWIVVIIRRRRRTPLEALMPSLDAQLVTLFTRGSGKAVE